MNAIVENPRSNVVILILFKILARIEREYEWKELFKN